VAACVVLLGTAGAAPAAPAALHCGDTVTVSVKLTRDLRNCPGDGLIVGASDITIDLGGHSISGTYPTDVGTFAAGINGRAGYDRVTLEGGRIEGFVEGADFLDARDVSLQRLALASNYDSAVYLERSPDARISRSSFANSYNGVHAVDSRAATVVDSSFTGHVDDGNAIYLEASAGFRASDSQIDDAWRAIRADDSPRGSIRENHISDSAHVGIALIGSSDATVVHNTVLRSADYGIEVVNSSNTIVSQNAVHTWDGDGIAVTGTASFGNLPATGNSVLDNELSSGSTGIEVIEVDRGNVRNTLVARNHVYNTTDIGILVDAVTTLNGDGFPPYEYTLGIGPSDTRVVENITTRNQLDGIRIDSPGNRLARNEADRNGSWGIFAVNDTSDGGGNRARGNGEPAQCSGVPCSR
jgi:parallel beta-helix repeat protein